MPSLKINDIPVTVKDGATVLQAARRAGVRVPTMCYLENVQCLGACRVCLVENENDRRLIAACSTPAVEGMSVLTHTRRVRDARRAVVELLLSEHEGDCQTCERSKNCELQTLAYELGIREQLYPGQTTHHHVDESTPGLKRDTGKCIKCRRCVSVCKEIQNVGALFPQGRGFDGAIGPAFNEDLDTVACVQCGQCAAVCPVGAITERSHVDDVWRAIEDPNIFVVAQTAPAIRAALGEIFNYEPGTLVTGKMVSALRRIGFDAVFDTNFTADLTILEEGNELLRRLRQAMVDGHDGVLPMFTSCCPAWIRYMEYNHGDLLPNLSTCKSPQQMFGAIAKTYYAKKIGRKPEELFVVSLMPCTAKKSEMLRDGMDGSGVRDVDAVLTTREFGRMIREANIDFRSLPDDAMDAPLGLSSGAADIFATTGGVMEAALRTAYEVITGRELPTEDLHVPQIAGLVGVKEAAITIKSATTDWAFLEGQTMRVAVAHGLKNAETVIEAVKTGQRSYQFIEVMACPGGCIGGGGQPRFCTDEVRNARIEAIYREDEGKPLRKSHKNPDVAKLYEEFLGQPLGEVSHHLLHTHYAPRRKI